MIKNRSNKTFWVVPIQGVDVGVTERLRARWPQHGLGLRRPSVAPPGCQLSPEASWPPSTLGPKLVVFDIYRAKNLAGEFG